MRVVVAACLLAAIGTLHSEAAHSSEQAQPAAERSDDNRELAALFAADQADRNPGYDGIDWDVVSKRDDKRRERTLELLRAGAVATSQDHLNAAYIFQHGTTVEDARLALSLAWVAASIDLDNETAKWLTAAAWDRLMMWQGRPQWYDTQFRRNERGVWVLYTIDEDAVTDTQRQSLQVPTLEETRERLRRRNEP